MTGPAITLMRHGRPDIASRGWLSARNMAGWVRDYNRAHIADAPPPKAVATVASASIILCSPLPRAMESARLLSQGRDVRIEPQSGEATLPLADWAAPSLPPALWLGLFRLAWLVGWSGQGQSRHEAQAKAQSVADTLIQHAGQDAHVCLIGHGIMNAMIARALRRRGWSGPGLPPRGYWQSATYGMRE